MQQAFLIDGARTPIGRYGGALSAVRPDDLAALVVAEAVRRAGVDPELVDEVVLGAAFPTRTASSCAAGSTASCARTAAARR